GHRASPAEWHDQRGRPATFPVCADAVMVAARVPASAVLVRRSVRPRSGVRSAAERLPPGTRAATPPPRVRHVAELATTDPRAVPGVVRQRPGLAEADSAHRLHPVRPGGLVARAARGGGVPERWRSAD